MTVGLPARNLGIDPCFGGPGTGIFSFKHSDNLTEKGKPGESRGRKAKRV
jgi:hypothetical protein